MSAAEQFLALVPPATAAAILRSVAPKLHEDPVVIVADSFHLRAKVADLLVEATVSWSDAAGAILRTDGPQFHRDIGAAFPILDGARIHLDSLASQSGSWHLYLHSSRPPVRGRDRRRKKDLITVQAEDDRGRRYLPSYDKTTIVPEDRYPMTREDLIVRFSPRLDPLARTLKLTIQGKHQELPVDLEIGGNGPA